MQKLFKKLKACFSKRNYPYEAACPFCTIPFRYMRYSGMSQSFPHFYCNKCSNVIRRQSDFDKVMRNGESEKLLLEITTSLPDCSCGGHFSSGTHFKCPHCHKEIPNQYSAVARLTDPFMVLVEGAKLYTK